MARVDRDREFGLAFVGGSFARRRAETGAGPESRLRTGECALESDGEPAGFEWIDVDNAFENIVAFKRRSPQTGRELVCVCNFSALPKKGYRLGLPENTEYELVINSDAEEYGGSGSVSITSLPPLEIDLPPLSTLWFVKNESKKKKINRTKRRKTE